MAKTWRLSQCLNFFYVKLSFCNPLVTLMTSRQGPGCRVWFKTGGMTGVRPWHDTQPAWPDLGCPLPPPSSLLSPSLQSLYSSFRESVTVMCELELHLLSVLVMRSNLRSTYKSSLSESMQKVLSPNHWDWLWSLLSSSSVYNTCSWAIYLRPVFLSSNAEGKHSLWW